MIKIPVLDESGNKICMIEIEKDKIKEFGNKRRLSVWVDEIVTGEPNYFEDQEGNLIGVPGAIEVRMMGAFKESGLD